MPINPPLPNNLVLVSLSLTHLSLRLSHRSPPLSPSITASFFHSWPETDISQIFPTTDSSSLRNGYTDYHTDHIFWATLGFVFRSFPHFFCFCYDAVDKAGYLTSFWHTLNIPYRTASYHISCRLHLLPLCVPDVCLLLTETNTFHILLNTIPLRNHKTSPLSLLPPSVSNS